MSAEKIDLAALDRDLQEFARQQKNRGWWRRNWRRLVLVLLLLMVAGAGGAYWLLIGRIHHLEVYQTAMQAIRADKELREQLGEPIHSVKWPLRMPCPAPGSRTVKSTSSGPSMGRRPSRRLTCTPK